MSGHALNNSDINESNSVSADTGTTAPFGNEIQHAARLANEAGSLRSELFRGMTRQ